MSYTLACGDVMPGCPMTFEQDSRDQILAAVASHAREAHGITEITPEVLSEVHAAMRIA